jgi:hypothetical protein
MSFPYHNFSAWSKTLAHLAPKQRSNCQGLAERFESQFLFHINLQG